MIWGKPFQRPVGKRGLPSLDSTQTCAPLGSFHWSPSLGSCSKSSNLVRTDLQHMFLWHVHTYSHVTILQWIIFFPLKSSKRPEFYVGVKERQCLWIGVCGWGGSAWDMQRAEAGGLNRLTKPQGLRWPCWHVTQHPHQSIDSTQESIPSLLAWREGEQMENSVLWGTLTRFLIFSLNNYSLPSPNLFFHILVHLEESAQKRWGCLCSLELQIGREDKCPTNIQLGEDHLPDRW